jgi:hypothetical protein
MGAIVLSGGLSGRGRGKFTTHLHVVPKVKNERRYISTPPICLHGVERGFFKN